MMRALIVVDIQNDFCPGGALAVSGAHEIVAPVNDLMHRYDKIVLTQDYHCAGHASFASTQGQAPFSTMMMPYGAQVLWPDHCIGGQWGSAFHPDLDTSLAHMILRKGYHCEIDSYSAFYENDKTTKTGLLGFLQDHGIHELDFVGLATDFCVAWSAVDAAFCGFDTRILTAYTRAIDLDGSLADALDRMKQAGIEIIEAP